MLCGRAIFQNDCPPILTPPDPPSFPDPSSRRETANTVEAIDTAAPARAFEFAADFLIARSASSFWASPTLRSGRVLSPLARGRSRLAFPPRRRTVSAQTGNGRFCNRSGAVKPLRISASAPGPVIYEGTLARRPLPRGSLLSARGGGRSQKRRASVTSIRQLPRRPSAPVPHRNRWSRR